MTNGTICGSCISTPPSFDATTALLTYDYPVDGLLQHYKYNASLNLAQTFASLFVEKKHTQLTTQNEINLIIPMPMHQNRLKERGFNQALEIAKLLSKAFTIKLDYTSCQRTKHTPPQASLNLKDRIKNIKGAFGCQQNLQNLNIAIVDDVMTTGASLNELAKTLKQAGAAHVECWVMARTLPK
ncbi:ComF family protein [Methylotenera sp. L2L1]|uniref:ComF family protein n=1 Tax=Methylotenera sp. L2L1 TaxID=1502770 RepID=UPI001F36B96B|nr:ComF family protein [Methylotenera sp. L2L1]